MGQQRIDNLKFHFYMLKVVKMDVLPVDSHKIKLQTLTNQVSYKWGKIPHESKMAILHFRTLLHMHNKMA